MRTRAEIERKLKELRDRHAENEKFTSQSGISEGVAPMIRKALIRQLEWVLGAQK